MDENTFKRLLRRPRALLMAKVDKLFVDLDQDLMCSCIYCILSNLDLESSFTAPVRGHDISVVYIVYISKARRVNKVMVYVSLKKQKSSK